MHRNSQKRYIIKNAVYFITTNTHNRIEYFHEDILCDLLVEDLKETQRLKCFIIFAYKVNPDHMHALIQPRGMDSYSEIMRSFKTNFSRNANRVMGFDANCEKLIISRPAGSRDPACRGTFNDDLACDDVPRNPACNGIPRDPAGDGTSDDPARNGISRDDRFNGMFHDAAYVKRIAGYRRRFIARYNFHAPFPKFKWQSSFYDHIIRDRRDFVIHLGYIRRQWLKHKLLEAISKIVNRHSGLDPESKSAEQNDLSRFRLSPE